MVKQRRQQPVKRGWSKFSETVNHDLSKAQE